MKLQIIENNARRHGLIVINGWSFDCSDINLGGSDKQVEWARDILRQAVIFAAERVGKSQKLIVNGILTEEDMEKFQPQIDDFMAQLAPIFDGADAGKIIEARHGVRIERIVKAVQA